VALGSGKKAVQKWVHMVECNHNQNKGPGSALTLQDHDATRSNLVTQADSTQILKTCNKCGVPQPLTNFHVKKNTPDGRNYTCKECFKAYRRQYYLDHIPEHREYYHTKGKYYFLDKLYGVAPEQYDQLMAEQGGVCAICKHPPAKLQSLHLDHDHLTGKPRGLLCAKCNTMLSYFGDRPEGLLRVLDYALLIAIYCQVNSSTGHKEAP
jgi:hypothetical protein